MVHGLPVTVEVAGRPVRVRPDANGAPPAAPEQRVSQEEQIAVVASTVAGDTTSPDWPPTAPHVWRMHVEPPAPPVRPPPQPPVRPPAVPPDSPHPNIPQRDPPNDPAPDEVPEDKPIIMRR
jgi:hypothetical protein